ncbi:MAG: zinc ABC transporter substrate-binding protein [Spirochaetaceae bacterium]|jgi:zinc transport system substrate-binding protein|nr:zinc ABC transporter substrate-binding protein [Spirochaetaceae bacterium]
MKRFLFMMLTLSLSVCALFATGKKEEAANDGKPDVVTVNFPSYDFVRQIAGDRATLTMLLPPGAESHSFEPTPRDIIKIQDCDVFIYVGGENDVWVDRVLESMDTSKMKIIRMMDAVYVVEEEIVEGMENDGHGHGEFDPANVKDRLMSDFSGSWKSGIPFLNNGSLDSYLAHRAEEEGKSTAEIKASLNSSWASDYDALTVTGNTLGIGNRSAGYAYRGYEIVESDHGASVWYKYQITAPTGGLPAYIMFNDHGDGNEEEHHEEEHHDEHEHEGVAHIHFKYGNASFAALLERAGWAGMFFDADASAGEIVETLAGHGHEHEEEAAYDEHIWTSPKNAQRIVRVIADALCEVDAANSALFRRNAEAYNARLAELDREFQAVVDAAKRKTIVFGDRFPFRYFADAYGLTYFAAFPGCSTDTEPSAATIAFLINKVKVEKIPVVFHIDLSNEKMADTIAEATGAKKLLLHAAHNISKRDFDNGVTFMDAHSAGKSYGFDGKYNLLAQRF